MAGLKVPVRSHEACSGCSLCLLACPVWRSTRDIRLTPHGRAKAVQHGVSLVELADSVDACTLCGACEPACPEDIALVDEVRSLRGRLASLQPERGRLPSVDVSTVSSPHAAAEPLVMLLADAALASRQPMLDRLLQVLDSTRLGLAADNGADIAQALEAGAAIDEARLQRFLAPLRSVSQIIVCDGLLLRGLRGWLPGKKVDSLGYVITAMPLLRRRLRSSDLYVIDPRAFHADWQRMVRHYDAVRAETGCAMNLDLQRLAIPTTAGSLPALSGRNRVDVHEQASWILEGLEVARIVVENLEDMAVFKAVSNKRVVHVAELG
jgi:ferredoxin